MRIGCVLMAAGNAARFGENKLLHPLMGRCLLEWTLEAIPASLFDLAVAVVSDPRVEALAAGAGYHCVRNPDPSRGQGTSIALGARAMRGLDAALFYVADQPCLTQASVRRVLDAYRPGRMVALAYHGRRGNPVLFPADLFPALETITPAETGKAVIYRHLERLVLVEADHEIELFDVDSRADLEKIKVGIAHILNLDYKF